MSSAKQPLLAALATVLLWAFAFPASKAALPYFSAEQIVLLRYAVACGFYLALFAAGRFAWPQLRDLPLIFILGVLGVTVYQLLFVHGIGRVTAGAAAMIIAAIPVFAGLLARFFLREKLSRPAWCGIAISLAGVALIAVEKDIAGEFSGAILLIMATVSVSIYFVFQKPFFSRYSPLSLTAWTSLAGTLSLLYQLPAAVDAALQAPAVALWSVAAMGVFSSGIGFVLWLYALSKLPAGTVTSFLFLQPVFVTVMAWLWLDEIPTAQVFAGGAVILFGVALVLLPGNRFAGGRWRIK
ncbi:MAG: DMT family transporter [Gammaproteobacteria bacterium]|nr:DMT family transporter [Gammaproteobacteria bacterium]